jgi:hypothetical protein
MEQNVTGRGILFQLLNANPHTEFLCTQARFEWIFYSRLRPVEGCSYTPLGPVSWQQISKKDEVQTVGHTLQILLLAHPMSNSRMHFQICRLQRPGWKIKLDAHITFSIKKDIFEVKRSSYGDNSLTHSKNIYQ